MWHVGTVGQGCRIGAADTSLELDRLMPPRVSIGAALSTRSVLSEPLRARFRREQCNSVHDPGLRGPRSGQEPIDLEAATGKAIKGVV